MKIKPHDWLYLTMAVVIIVLTLKGDLSNAVKLLELWLKK